MERLTKRCKQALNDKMTKFKKFIEIALSEPKYHEKGNFSTQSTYDIYETNKLYPMASKLADYEDAEEQGLLLRLPCKVGDVVAIVLFLPSTGKRYIEQAEVKEINIGKYNLREDIQLKVEPISKRGVIYKYYLSEWGENIFSTLTEAEKALADMGV